MNVASLPLCKELYELSGWDETYLAWTESTLEGVENPMPRPGYEAFQRKLTTDSPAYDLGYLLRKLPKTTLIQITADEVPKYHAWFSKNSATWDTPEDAAAKLAIELFKQGVLSKPEKGVEG